MSRRASVSARWLLPALLWWLPGAAQPAQPEAPALRGDGPLRVRNLSPATHPFGLPHAVGGFVRPGETPVVLHVEHANNFTAGAGTGPGAADTVVVFDGSTTVTTLGVRGTLSERLEWGLEIPYVFHSGGVTDGFIDGFHDLFGFPDGGRDAAPRDRLSYRIAHGGEEIVTVDDAGGHLGDLRGWVGVRLSEGAAREAMLRTWLKAPTGRAEDLSGSGGADLAATVELVERAALSRIGITMTLMAGITALGEGDLAEAGREDAVFSGHLGLHLPVGAGVTLRAQLDAHSDVVDSGVRQLAGGAVQGTLGGTVALARAAWLDLGLSEDLSGASSPDVVFLLTLGARL